MFSSGGVGNSMRFYKIVQNSLLVFQDPDNAKKY